METKGKIIDLLMNTKRAGMEALIKYLVDEGFFTSPASTRHHDCHLGGLASHSLRVYELLVDLCPANICDATSPGQDPLPLDCGHDCNSLAIAALLHDVCKVGAYVRTKADDGWTNNRAKDKGHALLSLVRVSRFIKLTALEELMIRYHMGVYGLKEFSASTGEYPLRGDETLPKEERRGKSLANTWFHNPIVKLMYFCDELSMFEEKARRI